MEKDLEYAIEILTEQIKWEQENLEGFLSQEYIEKWGKKSSEMSANTLKEHIRKLNIAIDKLKEV